MSARVTIALLAALVLGFGQGLAWGTLAPSLWGALGAFVCGLVIGYSAIRLALHE